MTIRVEVPLRFWDDHVSRELNSYASEVKRTKKRAFLELTTEQMRELRNDAAYYAAEWKHMGPEYIGLGRSAAATVAALIGKE